MKQRNEKPKPSPTKQKASPNSTNYKLQTTDCQTHMRRALSLAMRGFGRVEPNPMVGAVIVRGGDIIAEGWHEAFGAPHAEINAIQAAGAKCKGATLYVTLEPCSHFGKTPPCVDAVIKAGFKRVVVAARDPNPMNHGKGVRKLRRAGIKVVEGVLREEAVCLNRPFEKFMNTGMPYVIAKWAMTLDGKIATRTGDSKWITSKEARQAARVLRSFVGAILVGVDTVIKDDPLLTCRVRGQAASRGHWTVEGPICQAANHRLQSAGVKPTAQEIFPFAPWLSAGPIPFPPPDPKLQSPILKPREHKYCKLQTTDSKLPSPVRVILDSRARTPLTSRIVRTARKYRTIIATTPNAPHSRRKALAQAGCKVLVLPAERRALSKVHGCAPTHPSSSAKAPEYVSLRALLAALGKMGILSVLVEGGSHILGSFFDQRLVDHVIAFVSPTLVGGQTAPPPLSGKGISKLKNAIHLRNQRVLSIGNEVILLGDCK